MTVKNKDLQKFCLIGPFMAEFIPKKKKKKTAHHVGTTFKGFDNLFSFSVKSVAEFVSNCNCVVCFCQIATETLKAYP